MLPWLQNFDISKMDADVNNEFQSFQGCDGCTTIADPLLSTVLRAKISLHSHPKNQSTAHKSRTCFYDKKILLPAVFAKTKPKSRRHVAELCG